MTGTMAENVQDQRCVRGNRPVWPMPRAGEGEVLRGWGPQESQWCPRCDAGRLTVAADATEGGGEGSLMRSCIALDGPIVHETAEAIDLEVCNYLVM